MNRIVSALPGRIRVREPALRARKTNERLQTVLADFDGVLSVEGNQKTGSLLVRYDVRKVSPQAMEAQIEAAVGAESGSANGASSVSSPRGKPPETAAVKDLEPNEASLRPADRQLERRRQIDRRGPPYSRRAVLRRLNGYAKIGMLTSLAASLALAAGGSKRLHAATGGVYLALLGIHMAVHRHHLLK